MNYRLVALTTSYPLAEDGCAGIFVRSLYRNLPRRWSVDVVCPDSTHSSFESRKDAPTDQRLNLHAVRYAPKKWQVLAQQSGGVISGLNRAPWRLILLPSLVAGLFFRTAYLARRANLIHANWALCGAIAVVVGKILRVPVITTLRGDDFARADQSRVDRFILSAAVLGSRYVVCVSEAIAESVRHRYPDRASHIYVCLNGVDDIFFRNIRPTDFSASVSILTIGSLIKRKGYDVLIEAVAAMRNRASIKVRVVGEGPERADLLRKVNLLGLNDNFEFFGEVAPREIPELLSGSDIFVLASRSEGRPNVVLEALASGIPVVCTRLPGIDGLIVDGHSGWLVDIGDSKQLSAVLDDVVESPKERLRRASIGREKMWTGEHSWAATGILYDKLFELALDSNDGGSRPCAG